MRSCGTSTSSAARSKLSASRSRPAARAMLGLQSQHIRRNADVGGTDPPRHDGVERQVVERHSGCRHGPLGRLLRQRIKVERRGHGTRPSLADATSRHRAAPHPGPPVPSRWRKAWRRARDSARRAPGRRSGTMIGSGVCATRIERGVAAHGAVVVQRRHRRVREQLDVHVRQPVGAMDHRRALGLDADAHNPSRTAAPPSDRGTTCRPCGGCAPAEVRRRLRGRHPSAPAPRRSGRAPAVVWVSSLPKAGLSPITTSRGSVPFCASPLSDQPRLGGRIDAALPLQHLLAGLQVAHAAHRLATALRTCGSRCPARDSRWDRSAR